MHIIAFKNTYKEDMNVIHVLEPLASNAMAKKINELEHTLGTVLPSHFKDFLMQNNVCKPHKNHYKDKETEFTINYFLGFSENKNDDIIATYNDYEGRIPEELIPIANVDGGDWLCINKITGKVYYWFHEENDWGLEGNDKYPTLVSENLNDFIEKLTPTPLPTKEEIKRAIASGKVTITPKSVELKNAMRAKEGLPPLTFEEWDRLLNDPNRDMEYIIQPLIGVNEFVFGDYRKDILAKTSLKIKSTKEENDGNNSFIIDDYGDFLAYYNQHDQRLFFLTFVPLPTVKLIFEGKNLFGMKSSSIYQQLSSHDNNLLEEDYVGFASSVLGIDIYAPNFADDKDCVCEGISVAVKDYFDAIYKAESWDIETLLSEAF